MHNNQVLVNGTIDNVLGDAIMQAKLRHPDIMKRTSGQFLEYLPSLLQRYTKAQLAEYVTKYYMLPQPGGDVHVRQRQEEEKVTYQVPFQLY